MSRANTRTIFHRTRRSEAMNRVSALRVNRRIVDAPVFALGFRPLYLAALIFAVAAVPLWIAVYSGIVRFDGYLASMHWHGHEMIFGFAAAVIAGFLLTAVRNWTNRPTLTGVWLGGLVALWLLARVLMLTGPAMLAALLDSLFLPALAIAVAIPIWQSRNFRNVKLLFVLAALATANTVFHLAYQDRLPRDMALSAMTAALNVIAILIAIMAGRVIPAFTKGAVKDARPRHNAVVEVIAIGSLTLILLGDLLGRQVRLPSIAWLALLILAALAHAIRLALWQPHRTARNPLLWMLPVAYAWLPIALSLRALGQMGFVLPAAAVHAFTIGAMSSLMMAMMTRSALGHTGRPLVAGPAEIWAFLILQLAAIVRVFAGSFAPEFYTGVVTVSGTLWMLAFGIVLFRYWPILTRPRIDGRPG